MRAAPQTYFCGSCGRRLERAQPSECSRCRVGRERKPRRREAAKRARELIQREVAPPRAGCAVLFDQPSRTGPERLAALYALAPHVQAAAWRSQRRAVERARENER